MKKLLLPVIAVLCMTLSSCDKDKTTSTEGNIKSKDLIGTWETIHIKGYEIENGKRNDFDMDIDSSKDDDKGGRIIIKEDKTIEMQKIKDGQWQTITTGKWILVVNTFTIQINGQDNDDATVLQIMNVNNTNLEMKGYDKDDNGDESSITWTFKKI